MKSFRFIAATLLGLALFAVVAPARAATTNRWDATVGVGLTLTRGNSDTMLGTLTLKAQR